MKNFQDEITVLKGVRKSYQESKTKKASFFTMLLNAVFRSITNDKEVKYVSKEALKIAKQKGVDLSKMNYKHMKKVDPNKEWLYYEHCNPIKDLRLAILETDEDIEKIVERDFICWITRKEQAILDKYFKDHRENWKKCFRYVGIEFVRNKSSLYNEL